MDSGGAALFLLFLEFKRKSSVLTVNATEEIVTLILQKYSKSVGNGNKV